MTPARCSSSSPIASSRLSPGHRSDLVEIAGTISRIAADMARRRTAAVREQLAFKRSEILREQGEELAEQPKSVAEGIPNTSVGVVAGTAVISVVLQEITKSGWQTIVAAFPRYGRRTFRFAAQT